MEHIKPGDVVTRKSYGNDIYFKVKKVEKKNGKNICILKGMAIRLLADAPVEDLEKKDAYEILKFRHKFILESTRKMRSIRRKRDEELLVCNGIMERGEKREVFDIPGRVVHIDGDEEYLEKCLDVYKQLKIPARGFNVEESNQPEKVVDIVKEHSPDILVITGHDALLKNIKSFSDIESYRNSKYFVHAVKNARKIEPSRDELIIFAGGCQSHYEALLEAGANFASSPQRVFIHAYDPVFIVERLAYTPIKDIVTVEDLIDNTITGAQGIGGIETRGRYRMGFPKSPY